MPEYKLQNPSLGLIGPLKLATVRDLAKSIQHEASRLSRVVANLLDITTLEAGRVRLNRQPYFIQEIIGSALSRAEPVLAGRAVETRASEDLPMAMVRPHSSATLWE